MDETFKDFTSSTNVDSRCTTFLLRRFFFSTRKFDDLLFFRKRIFNDRSASDRCLVNKDEPADRRSIFIFVWTKFSSFQIDLFSTAMIKQPLYHRFSLDRPSPLSPTSYQSPPSLNYRTMAAADRSFNHSAANIKQQLYISFSKPVNK